MQGICRLLVALALLSGPVAALAGGVLIEPREDEIARVEAPHLLTRAITVANGSAQPRDFCEAVLLPAGWQNVTADSLFSLSPGGRDVRLLCISIPADAAPGTHSLTYILRERVSDRSVAETRIPVEVLPVLKLELAVREAPRRVLAGEEFAVRFEVASRGNMTATVKAQVRASSGLPVRMDEPKVTLAPGERRTLTAYVRSNRDLAQAEPQWLTIRAETTDGEVRAAAQSTISVHAMPRPSRGEDLYRRVPSTLAVRYVGAEEQKGAQVEFGGSGTLDARGHYRVQYLVRGPNDLERHVWGLRDEYSLSLQSRAGELRAGDLLFSLSSLTEQNRLGRGGTAQYRIGPFAAGGYRFTSRLKYPDLTETAVFLRFTPRLPLRLSVNLLDKTTADARRRMMTLAGSASVSHFAEIETEGGIGESVRNPDQFALAARGRISASLPLKGRLTAEKTYAAPGFPGYYRDQDHNVISLYLPLTRKVLWQSSLRSAAQNLERDTSRASALREQHLLSGVACELPFRTQGNVELESVSRRDAIEPADYDYSERLASLRLRYRLQPFTFAGSLRSGITHNRKTGERMPLHRYGVNLSFAPDSRQNYTASYQTGRSSMSSSVNRVFGLSASCRPLPGLSLSANWQRSRYDSDMPYENNQAGLDVRYTFLRRHVITFRYRELHYEREEFSRGRSWMIAYELPLGMPVSREEKFGCVKGRVRNAEDPVHAGIGGVVLTLGNHAVLTDRKGNFIFPAVEPGVRYLQVEKSTVGLDRVTTRRVPIELRVRGGRTEVVDVGITRAARLTGEVALFGLGDATARGILVESDREPLPSSDSLRYLGGQAGVEIELRSGDDVHRTLTDRNGRFHFDELRPGRWVLAVSPVGLPPFHDLECESTELNLESASHRDLTVRVVPRTRSVIIVDEGKVPVISKRK